MTLSALAISDVLRFLDATPGGGAHAETVRTVIERMEAAEGRLRQRLEADAARRRRSPRKKPPPTDSRDRHVTPDVTQDVTSAVTTHGAAPSDLDLIRSSQDQKGIADQRGSRESARTFPAARLVAVDDKVHAGHVAEMFSAARKGVNGAGFRAEQTNYRMRDQVAEWANDDVAGLGLLPRELIAKSLAGFVADTAMRRKGWPFGMWAADPGAFIGIRPPAVAAHAEFAGDTAESVFGPREGTNG